MYYVLYYQTVEGYIQRREQYRDEHLALAKAAHERGELMLAGALGDPVESAVLVFKGDSPAIAENFAENDPYVKNGLVEGWHVRQWHLVIGSL
jgi:uncharacterized protein YciI